MTIEELQAENSKIRVLLVDDQAIVGAGVQRMLESNPEIEFHFCQNPKEALKTAIEVKPAIILQDLVMPDIDGMTLLRFYKGHPELKDVPVVVLSSKEEATTKAEAFGKGAHDYLVKLPDKVELIARIRYHANSYIHLLQRNAAYHALDESKKALQKELDKAARYVTSLLPKEMTTGDIQTHWRFVPSAQLGGDTFGHFEIDDDHFAFFLLDVSGHGIGAALMSVSAMNVLRGQSLPNTDFKDPVAVAQGMNKAFQMEDHNDLYFTLWYGVFQKSTRKLDYIGCGHPPALLLREDKSYEELRADNFFIGGLPFFPYEKKSTVLEPNVNLYLFSDGVFEIINKDDRNLMWSDKEMHAMLAANYGGEKSEIDILNEFVHEYSGLEILDDDFSMIRITFA